MKKYIFLIIGILYAYAGWDIMHGGNHYMYDVPIPILSGGPILVAAIAITLIALFWRPPKISEKICPKCLIVDEKAHAGSRCAQCNGPLVPLKGFFDRHPNLRDSGPLGPHEPQD